MKRQRQQRLTIATTTYDDRHTGENRLHRRVGTAMGDEAHYRLKYCSVSITPGDKSYRMLQEADLIEPIRGDTQLSFLSFTK